MMSHQHRYAQFLFQLADLGMRYDSNLHRAALNVLTMMPPDIETANKLRRICKEAAENPDNDNLSSFDGIFFAASPTEVVYNLGVIYTLMMPAVNPLSDEAQEFQCDFVKSGCGIRIVELLTRNNFLSKADDLTKM